MRRLLMIMVLLAFAGLVGAGCGQFGKVSTGGGPGGAAGGQDTLESITDEPFDEQARKRDGCGEIEELEDRGRQHVEEDVDYKDNPPAGDNHDAVPLDWGVYDEPQRDEKWVHNLEHGHIAVLYDGLSKKEAKELLGDIKQAPYHVVALPRSANPKDGVYFVAWGYRLYCRHPSEPALQEFREQRLDQGPELLMRDKPKGE